MIQRIANKESGAGRLDSIAWDDLWSNTLDATPLSRSACLAHCASGFRTGPVKKITTFENGRMVAGLPLMEGRKWKFFRSFNFPNNSWLQAGALLTDHQRITTRSYQQMAQQIRSLPGSLVVLDWAYESSELDNLLAELRRIGSHVVREPQFKTGFIEISGSWENYFLQRSKGFRKKIRSSFRKLEELGSVQLERYSSFDDLRQLTGLFDAAVEIESLGWKGQQGTDLNSNPVVRKIFLDVWSELASAGMLEILFLKIGNKRIAFEFGYRSKRIYYSHKIGFDPQFANFSPGQVLVYQQLREWFRTGEVKQVDTVGEIDQAIGKWCTEIRQRYRYTIATGSCTGWIPGQINHCKRIAKRLLRR